MTLEVMMQDEHAECFSPERSDFEGFAEWLEGTIYWGGSLGGTLGWDLLIAAGRLILKIAEDVMRSGDSDMKEIVLILHANLHSALKACSSSGSLQATQLESSPKKKGSDSPRAAPQTS